MTTTTGQQVPSSRQAADRLGSAAYGLTAEDSCRGVSFAAPYQAMNAALAVKVLEILEIEGVTC